MMAKRLNIEAGTSEIRNINTSRKPVQLLEAKLGFRHVPQLVQKQNLHMQIC
jgi:hypothetical protein